MAQERLANFEEICQIGEGSFGSVFKVRHRKTGDIYVLKKISTTGMSYEDRKDAKQEFLIHKTLKCEYIVKYESHFTDKGFICILLEYMDGGDVGQYLKNLGGMLLDEIKVWDFFIQTCLGVQYLHARKILHRDLKTINLFLNKNGRLKIGDLGVAKEVKGTHTQTIVGTPYYLSPELCEEKPYNNKSDIWSLGCILYELCTLRHPFDAKTQGGLFLKIIKGDYEPIPEHYSKALAEIIAKCLQKNCKDRPSIQQILENEKLIDMAIELGHVIPTDDEVTDLITSQKTDFMTTFAKKKAGKGSSSGATAGATSGSGAVGLMSRDKLKNKQIVTGTNIQNNPPERPKRANRPLIGGAKYKQQSKSAMVEVMDITDDAIDTVDKLLNPSSAEKDKLAYGSKSKDKSAGGISARGNIGRRLSPNNPDTDKPGSSSRKKESSAKGPAPKPVERPRSNYNPQRKYNKPWQKQKAEPTPEDSKKILKSDEKDKNKDDARKKANDILANRRKQIRPVMIKKCKTDVHKEDKDSTKQVPAVKEEKKKSPVKDNKSDTAKGRKRISEIAPDIHIEGLEAELDEMPKKAPKPIPQSAGVEPRAKGLGMRKLRSHAVDNKLKIPLAEVDDDFVPRDIEPEIEKPLNSTKGDTNESNTINGQGKRGSKAFKMIGDIKKQMKSRGNKSQDMSNNFTDENTQLTLDNDVDETLLTTGHVDEVEGITRSYVSNDEEDKIGEYHLSGKSKGSSSNNENTAYEYEGEDDFVTESTGANPYNYADKNFYEDDEDLCKTPFGDFGLDEINEEEELFDEVGIEKRHIKERLRELETQVKEKWDELEKDSDKETIK